MVWPSEKANNWKAMEGDNNAIQADYASLYRQYFTAPFWDMIRSKLKTSHKNHDTLHWHWSYNFIAICNFAWYDRADQKSNKKRMKGDTDATLA